jgi:hypothetical protein
MVIVLLSYKVPWKLIHLHLSIVAVAIAALPRLWERHLDRRSFRYDGCSSTMVALL